MTIRVEEVRDRRALDGYEAEWRALVEATPSAELFSTPEWITSWLDAYWEGRPIAFLFARDGGRLAGVAPLLRDESGMLRCRGSLALPTDAGSWRGEITQAGDPAGEALAALFGYLRADGRFRLTLGRMATDSVTARALQDATGRSGLWAVWREEHGTPLVSLRGTFEEYLQSRSKHVRHELKRKRKKLEASGAMELRVVHRPEELDAALGDVMAVEARSWKGEAGTSFLEGPGDLRFFRSLIERTADRQWVRIYLLYHEGRPIAHLFGVVYGKRYYAINCSFDTAFEKHSPGAVVVLRAIEDGFAQGLETFDFLGSEYRWKEELATAIRPHLAVCLFPSLLSKCGWCWAMDQQLKPWVRRRLPVLIRAKRAAIAWGRGRARRDAARLQ